MAQPYIGEIRMFAGDYAPAQWRFCDGSLLAVSENTELFDVIGTTYGGDGQETFALPDLRGRVPIHVSGEFAIADAGGMEAVTLTEPQMPAHNHALMATSLFGSTTTPGNNTLASMMTGFPYINEKPDSAMAGTAVGPAGRGRPHNNLQPYLCVNFIISLLGIFPIRA